MRIEWRVNPSSDAGGFNSLCWSRFACMQGITWSSNKLTRIHEDLVLLLQKSNVRWVNFFLRCQYQPCIAPSYLPWQELLRLNTQNNSTLAGDLLLPIYVTQAPWKRHVQSLRHYCRRNHQLLVFLWVKLANTTLSCQGHLPCQFLTAQSNAKSRIAH